MVEALPIAGDVKKKVFKDAFEGITNGVQAVAKWSGAKVTTLTSSKMYDKVMSGFAIAVAGFGSVVFLGEAIWALSFTLVSPILALAVFTCDTFLALWCLQLLSELLRNTNMMEEPKKKTKKK